MKQIILKNLLLSLCLGGISYILIDSIHPKYRTEKHLLGYELDEGNLRPVVKGSDIYYEPKEKPVYKNVHIREFNLFGAIMAGLVITSSLLIQPLKQPPIFRNS